MVKFSAQYIGDYLCIIQIKIKDIFNRHTDLYIFDDWRPDLFFFLFFFKNVCNSREFSQGRRFLELNDNAEIYYFTYSLYSLVYASSAAILKENNCLIVCYKEIHFFSTEQIRYYKFDLRVHTLINYELNYYIVIILFFFF